MNKSDLRKIHLARRRNLSPGEKAEKSALIAEWFFRRFDLTDVRFLHGFLPIEKFGEINTGLIFDRVWSEHPHVATVAPRVNSLSGNIESIPFSAASSFRRNKFGIDEPASDETVAAEKIDIVLTPLLCFDRYGFRVGYGKGLYDKFLRQCRPDCLKIGLSFFLAIEEINDVHEFDFKLDFCITPEGIDEFSV